VGGVTDSQGPKGGGRRELGGRGGLGGKKKMRPVNVKTRAQVKGHTKTKKGLDWGGRIQVQCVSGEKKQGGDLASREMEKK